MLLLWGVITCAFRSRKKIVRFVRDRTLKLLLLLSRGEVVLEFELNILVPRSRMLGNFREVKH